MMCEPRAVQAGLVACKPREAFECQGRQLFAAVEGGPLAVGEELACGIELDELVVACLVVNVEVDVGVNGDVSEQQAGCVCVYYVGQSARVGI